jgi:glycosyltransferase involved in cell wall biosynthesis
MKLIYITNTRIPSEKANSYQSMQMCSSFSIFFDKVELWTGKARNTKELSEIKDVFKYYNVKETFYIKRFFQFDSLILALLNEFIWANLRGLIYSFNVCFHLMKYENDEKVVIYTRIWHVLLIYIMFQKVGLLNIRIFYEAHKFSKPLVNVISKIDGLIVINEFLKKKYNNFGLNRILTSHDGVNLNEHANISPYKFIPNKEEFTILYTGSLFKWKGVETLVNSIDFLPKNFKLVCVGGSGRHLRDFKSYVNKSSNSDRIKVIAHKPKKEVLKFVEDADVLILPNSAKDKMSLYTSPIKLFEYMASNRPIIASNISSIAEILSNRNSLLFESDSSEDLAKKILISASLDCQKIVTQARKDVEAYSWDKRAQNINEFIKSTSIVKK